MHRRHDPHRADDRRADTSQGRRAHESGSPVPARSGEDGELQQIPDAKPLVKKQQQQH